MRHGQAGRRALSRQADDMFGADVRGENRRADGEESDIAPGEKVVRRGLPPACDRRHQRQQHAEIGGDDESVERAER